MNSLESALRKAKPAVPLLPQDFSLRVMERINELELAPYHRYRTSTSRLVFAFIGGLFILFGMLSASLANFEIKASGSLELINFGVSYYGAFLSYLPVDTIVITLLFTTLSGMLIWKSRALRTTLVKIILVVYSLLFVSSAAIASTGINDQFHSWLIKYQEAVPIIRSIYQESMQFRLHRDDFKLGRVVLVKNNQVWIKDPFGNTEHIVLSENLPLQVGQYVKFAGKTVNEQFLASHFDFCDSDRTDMYYRHMRMHSEKMHGHKMMMKRMEGP